MSDLFISELLILFFLLIALLRPFSKFLKAVPSVVIFPIISMILSMLVIAGQGIYLSLVLIAVFALMVFIFTLPKFFAFINGLMMDMYSVAELVIHAFWLIVLCLLVFVVWNFAPVSVLGVSGKVVRQEIMLDGFPQRSFGEVLLMYDAETNRPISHENAKTTVVVLPNVKKAFYETDTIVRSFLNSGYKVVCIETFRPTLPIIPKNFYNFSAALKRLAGKWFSSGEKRNAGELPTEEAKQFKAVLSRIIEKHGGEAVFVFSSGRYTSNFLKNFDTDFAEKVNGAFVICEENSIPQLPHSFVGKATAQISFAGAARDAKFFFYVVPESYLSELSELRGDDVLLAALLGGNADIARASRIEMASVFEKWLAVKSLVD